MGVMSVICDWDLEANVHGRFGDYKVIIFKSPIDIGRHFAPVLVLYFDEDMSNILHIPNYIVGGFEHSILSTDEGVELVTEKVLRRLLDESLL